MSEQTKSINTPATVAPAAQAEGKRAAQEPTVEQVVQALVAQFKSDERITSYQIHVLANLGFQILQIEDEKTGELKQIKPQPVYNATKSIRAAMEAKYGQGDQHIEIAEAAKILTKILNRSGSGVRGERMDKAAILANAMKALKA